jgi:hypothetical protein
MYLKWLRRDCYTPKLERHIMHLLKFGGISHMIRNLIYGRWAALFTK